MALGRRSTRTVFILTTTTASSLHRQRLGKVALGILLWWVKANETALRRIAIINIFSIFSCSRQADRQVPTTPFYETWKWQEFSCNNSPSSCTFSTLLTFALETVSTLLHPKFNIFQINQKKWEKSSKLWDNCELDCAVDVNVALTCTALRFYNKLILL